MARSKLVYIGISIAVLLISLILFFPKIVTISVSSLYQKESLEVFGGKTDIIGVKYDYFTNFPNITIKIDKQISYNNRNETILELDDVLIELNPFSIFKKRYEVTNCEIKDVRLNLLREKDGRFNSIIHNKSLLTGDRIIDKVIIDNSNNGEEKNIENHRRNENEYGEPDNKLNIASKVFVKKLEIHNGVLNYRSIINNYIANFDNIKISSKGKIHGNIITMNLRVDIGKVDYLFNNNKNYSFKLNINTLLDIDSRANKFIISNANVYNEHINFAGNGSFLFLKDGLSINSVIKDGNISLESLIKNIPDELGVYKSNFTSNSKVLFDGKIGGFLNNYETPVFSFNFYLKDGEVLLNNKKFFHEINSNVSVENNSKNFFSTKIEVNEFNFKLPDSYFKSKARFIPILVSDNNDVKNVDFEFEASISSEMRLEHFRKIINIEPYRMFGFIHTSQDIVGKVSDFKKNNYRNIKSDGFSYLINAAFKVPGFPRIDIKKSTMFVFPSFINVSKTEAEIAGNKYNVEGRINDYTKAVTAKEINGEFNVYSPYANLSILVNEIEKEKKIFKDSDEYKKFVAENKVGKESKNKIYFPFNTNIIINSSTRNLQVNRIIIENVVSKIIVSNGDVRSNRISKGYRKIYMDR